MEEVCGGAINNLVGSSTQWVVVEGGAAAAFGGGFEHVFGVVAVGPDAVAGEVAVGVVAHGIAGDVGVLVEAIFLVGVGFVGGWYPPINIVAQHFTGELVDLVKAVGPGVVVVAAIDVVAEVLQGVIFVVAVAGDGAVA